MSPAAGTFPENICTMGQSIDQQDDEVLSVTHDGCVYPPGQTNSVFVFVVINEFYNSHFLINGTVVLVTSHCVKKKNGWTGHGQRAEIRITNHSGQETSG